MAGKLKKTVLSLALSIGLGFHGYFFVRGFFNYDLYLSVLFGACYGLFFFLFLHAVINWEDVKWFVRLARGRT